MNKARKFLIELLVLVIISTLVNTSWAQENQTKETFKQESKITTLQNIIDSSSVSKGDIKKEDTDIKKEDTEKETHKNLQRNVDRDISFLTLIVTVIGVLLTFLTLLAIIAVALGLLEIKKWNERRNELDEMIRKGKERLDDIEKKMEEIREKANAFTNMVGKKE